MIDYVSLLIPGCHPGTSTEEAHWSVSESYAHISILLICSLYCIDQLSFRVLFEEKNSTGNVRETVYRFIEAMFKYGTHMNTICLPVDKCHPRNNQFCFRVI